jgi:hypothetical protein
VDRPGRKTSPSVRIGVHAHARGCGWLAIWARKCPNVMPCQGKRAQREPVGVQVAKRLNSSVYPMRRQWPPHSSKPVPNISPTSEQGPAHSRRNNSSKEQRKDFIDRESGGGNAICLDSCIVDERRQKGCNTR